MRVKKTNLAYKYVKKMKKYGAKAVRRIKKAKSNKTCLLKR